MYKMRNICRLLALLPLLLFFAAGAAAAPEAADSVKAAKPVTTISGFVDIFYAFGFNKPQGNYRQPFLYNHNRHNEFNLNLGILKVAVAHQQYRANLALQVGTYPLDNYAAEPAVYRHIAEANAGLALNRKSNLWLDAGIFASHIGFENAVSSLNYTLTRSLLAENSPYYLAGAKLTFNPNQKFELAALICNGWQRIQRLEGNSLPGFGTQVLYTPHQKIKLNWSTFLGTDDPDSHRRFRVFNNFYGQFQLTEKFNLITGLDFGAQQQFKGSSDYFFWYSPVIIGRYEIRENWAAALRAEYYADPEGIIIPVAHPSGFKVRGFSANIDYSKYTNVMLRLEGRLLNSRYPVFEEQNKASRNDLFVVSTVAVTF